jgi:hypothetical protein
MHGLSTRPSPADDPRLRQTSQMGQTLPQSQTARQYAGLNRPPSALYAVAFRIIWRSVSELFGVKSWHAKADRSVEAARELAMPRFRLIQAASGQKPASTTRVRQLILKHYAK